MNLKKHSNFGSLIFGFLLWGSLIFLLILFSFVIELFEWLGANNCQSFNLSIFLILITGVLWLPFFNFLISKLFDERVKLHG
jgi:hypothetical protein